MLNTCCKNIDSLYRLQSKSISLLGIYMLGDLGQPSGYLKLSNQIDLVQIGPGGGGLDKGFFIIFICSFPKV